MLEDQKQLSEQLRQMQQKFMTHMEASAAQLQTLHAQLSQQALPAGRPASNSSQSANTSQPPNALAVEAPVRDVQNVREQTQPPARPPVAIPALLLMPLPPVPAMSNPQPMLVVEEPDQQSASTKQAGQQAGGSVAAPGQQLLLEAAPEDRTQQAALPQTTVDELQGGSPAKMEAESSSGDEQQEDQSPSMPDGNDRDAQGPFGDLGKSIGSEAAQQGQNDKPEQGGTSAIDNPPSKQEDGEASLQDDSGNSPSAAAADSSSNINDAP